MEIDFDPNKREWTLLERGLDFAHASEIFEGLHFTAEDTRQDYGEVRHITVGHMNGRLVVICWTPRGDARRIISMRKANEREISRFEKHLSYD